MAIYMLPEMLLNLPFASRFPYERPQQYEEKVPQWESFKTSFLGYLAPVYCSPEQTQRRATISSSLEAVLLE